MQGGVVRKAVQLACVVGAVAIGAAMVGGAALAETPSAPLPGVFGGVVSASGVFVHADSIPSQSPTSQPFYVNFAYGHTTYSPQTIIANAAPYNPGATVMGLAGLLCTAGLPPACGVPPLPLIATATPQHPHESVGFSPESGPTAGSPVQLGALSGDARAAATGVSSLSAVGSLDLGAGAGPNAAAMSALRAQIAAITGHPVTSASSALVHIGAITTTTKQAFKDAALVSTATAADSDISLLGGVIHIGAITATSTTKTDGGKVKTHADDATITGATVGGVPVTIDDKGVSVAGSPVLPASQVQALNAAIQQALTTFGVTIHFQGKSVGPSILEHACGNSEADGLQLTATQNLNQLPTQLGAVYFADIAIGAACSSATVVPDSLSANDTNATPSLAPSSSGDSGASTGGGSPSAAAGGSSPRDVGSSTSASSAGGGGSSTALTPAGPSNLAAPVTTGRSAPGLETDLASRVVSHRLTLLYLIYGLLFVAILLGVIPLVRPRVRGGA